jgi:DNA-binding cell septation regulator SpoVG
VTAIRVLEIRRLAADGALRAVATVQLGCVRLHNVRVVEHDGEFLVGLPQTPQRRKADGSGSGWSLAVEITNPDVFDALSAAVLAAWARS